MKLLVVILCLSFCALSACGSTSNHAADPQSVCRQWTRLQSHPGSDPMSAVSDMQSRLDPRRHGRLIRLLGAVIDDGFHNRMGSIDRDALRVSRYCAAL